MLGVEKVARPPPDLVPDGEDGPFPERASRRMRRPLEYRQTARSASSSAARASASGSAASESSSRKLTDDAKAETASSNVSLPV